MNYLVGAGYLSAVVVLMNIGCIVFGTFSIFEYRGQNTIFPAPSISLILHLMYLYH